MEQSGCLPHEEAKGGWNSNVKIRQHKMPPRTEGEKVREVTVTSAGSCVLPVAAALSVTGRGKGLREPVVLRDR